MREKLRAGGYRTWRGFTADLDLIAQNAKDYNGPKSIYWKAAASFQRAGKRVLVASELEGRKAIYQVRPFFTVFVRVVFAQMYQVRQRCAVPLGNWAHESCRCAQ